LGVSCSFPRVVHASVCFESPQRPFTISIIVGNDQGLRAAWSGPSHLNYGELPEIEIAIEIEKAWNLDFDGEFDFDFDKTICLRLPWQLRYKGQCDLVQIRSF
jgi:hypothetical protein